MLSPLGVARSTSVAAESDRTQAGTTPRIANRPQIAVGLTLGSVDRLRRATPPRYVAAMQTPPAGSIAVIFLSGRNTADAPGYAAAATAMETRAAAMPGYLGIDAARDAEGVGVTISWWADRAAALAWRDDAEHARIREQGRAVWYDWYRVIVAEVERGYVWQRG